MAVLQFWFDPANSEHWFAADPDFDAAIRNRFTGTLQRAIDGELGDWANNPQGWLALLIVLDQFPRNLYRHDPRAWAQDLPAQQLAVWGIEEGFDRRLTAAERVFAYMPLEHAEDIRLQRRCVRLLEALCDDVPAQERDRYTDFLDYARRHESVIARFGRFPHRNAMLGRTNTSEEQKYLDQPNSGF
nr:DUF924 family protein [Dyella sp. 2HG41-7]